MLAKEAGFVGTSGKEDNKPKRHATIKSGLKLKRHLFWWCTLSLSKPLSKDFHYMKLYGILSNLGLRDNVQESLLAPRSLIIRISLISVASLVLQSSKGAPRDL